MGRGRAHIEVEGLKEFQMAVKRAQGQLPKALGEAHKRVGQFVIDKLPEGPLTAIGKGAGAKIRPSATKREVLLRVGYGGREDHAEQWGKTKIQPFTSGRPYIVGTIEDNQEDIEQMFMAEMAKTFEPAFYSVE